MSEHPAASTAPLPTLAEVQAHRVPKPNPNEEHAESLTPLENLALWTTVHIGTMGFFFIIFLWTALWMGWNAVAKHFGWPLVFDAPWEFGIWLFISNLIQIHLMPLIMVGQNLQGRHAELRTEHQYQTALQNEYESEVLLQYLAVVTDQLAGITERLDKLEARS